MAEKHKEVNGRTAQRQIVTYEVSIMTGTRHLAFTPVPFLSNHTANKLEKSRNIDNKREYKINQHYTFGNTRERYRSYKKRCPRVVNTVKRKMPSVAGAEHRTPVW